MTTGTERIRSWHGPAVLSYGFRPFFLGGAVWAALASALWMAMLSGAVSLPMRFDPVSWHAHEFLFGYLGAVVAGFLLTAVPNWTGRLPIVGWPLGGLFALWLAGRLAVLGSALMPPLAVAALDLAMPVALTAALAREILVGRNWRNLKVLVLLLGLILGNAVFHWEALTGVYAAGGLGLRIGLASAILMIALIGGRIVPSFTRNWLSRHGAQSVPTPVGRFDVFALITLALALIAWIAASHAPITALLLLATGLIHAVRLFRWAGHQTGAEALVWVLHAGYALVPLGAVAIAVSILTQDAFFARAAQHIWMAGAIGLMTLAVMTRATLGHTRRALHAGTGTIVLYLLVILSVATRFAAGAVPEASYSLHMLSSACWTGAFAGFALMYGPMLMTAHRPA